MIRLLLFPIGAILISLFAYSFPIVLSGYVDAIVPLLGLVMFCMGMSLQITDFKQVILQPTPILLGVSLQFICMPLLAWGLSNTFSLPDAFIIGMILVGACPGGTASNVICYLARGNVALSIMLTSISTLLAVLLTPLLTLLYMKQSVPVPVWDMIKSLTIIILLPVLLGVLINSFFRKQIESIKCYLPLVSMLSVIMIIGIIVSKSQSAVMQISSILIIAVMLHNLLGYLLAYSISKFSHFDEITSRTIAIEVGMQNSGLGIVLAKEYFTAISALPGVLFSIWHNISGAVIAAYWSAKDAGRKGECTT